MAVALVTGASTGIGLETAILFARRGYRVYAGARTPGTSEGLKAAVAAGLPLTTVAIDVDSDSVRQAVRHLGPIDVLVNNAGIGSAAPLELLPIDELRALFETNVLGAVRVMQAVLPSMRSRGSGVIVNVSSVMGRLTLPCHGGYAASKHALAAISEALAMEMAPFGVRVAIIEPGVVLTPIWGKRHVALAEGHPYGRPLARLQRIFGSQMDGGTTPDVVAEAIYETVTRADAPLHVPVGADAEVWTAGRAAVTADEWVGLHAEPDEDTYAGRCARIFGVDTLSPPALHARRSQHLR